MPYEAGSVGNLVLIDVFHHLPRPARFLDEAQRVLAPGGRVVVLDPYCSPVSTIAYKLGHHEHTSLGVEAFGEDDSLAAHPLEGNQARATLAFFRQTAELERRWPELRLVEATRLALLLYPLSGGLTKRQLLPPVLWRPARRLERLLVPLAPLLASRCLCVLERNA